MGEALDLLEGPNEDAARSLSRVKVLVRQPRPPDPRISLSAVHHFFGVHMMYVISFK